MQQFLSLKNHAHTVLGQNAKGNSSVQYLASDHNAGMKGFTYNTEG